MPQFVIISVPERKQIAEDCRKRFADAGIECKIHYEPLATGRDRPRTLPQNIEFNQSWFGCSRHHINVLRTFADKFVCVIEDDAFPVKDFKQRFEHEIIDNLPDSADGVVIGWKQAFGTLKYINNFIHYRSGFFGTQVVLYHRESALSHLEKTIFGGGKHYQTHRTDKGGLRHDGLEPHLNYCVENFGAKFFLSVFSLAGQGTINSTHWGGHSDKLLGFGDGAMQWGENNINADGRVNLQQVDFVINFNCNVKCWQCNQLNWEMSDAPHESTGTLIERMLRWQKIIAPHSFRLIGGEPLLRKDLPELVSHALTIFSDAFVGIWTNGTLWTQEFDDRLRKAIQGREFYVDTTVSPKGYPQQFKPTIKHVYHQPLQSELRTLYKYRDGERTFLPTFPKKHQDCWAKNCHTITPAGYFRCSWEAHRHQIYDLPIQPAQTAEEVIACNTAAPTEYCKLCSGEINQLEKRKVALYNL